MDVYKLCISTGNLEIGTSEIGISSSESMGATHVCAT